MLFQQKAEDDDRNRADDDEPRLARVGVGERTPRRQTAKESADETDDVGREVDERREQRSELNDRARRRAGIAPAEKDGNDFEMGGGGDGDEFGEALDQT